MLKISLICAFIFSKTTTAQRELHRRGVFETDAALPVADCLRIASLTIGAHPRPVQLGLCGFSLQELGPFFWFSYRLLK